MGRIEDFIYFEKNKININDCNSILNTLEKDFQKHSWHNNTDNTITSSEDEFFVQNMNLKAKPYLKEIQLFLEKYCQKFKPIENTSNLINKMTFPRINFYKKGHRMKMHYDHIRSIFDGTERGIPILTIVGVLNNDFQGGEFIVADQTFNMKQGDLIIFPSCFIYPHAVKEIIDGERISFVSWAY
jgi:hypothetical protein